VTAPVSTPIRVSLTGANGGYGRTFLAQLRHAPGMTPAVLIDPDLDGVCAMLRALGWQDEQTARCATPAETGRAVAGGRVAVVPCADAIDWEALDVLVEATGRLDVGMHYAETAIAARRHVIMVSKEIESVAGVALAAAAAQAGVSYLPGDGDQPANLIRLVDWVERVGLEIVALGKSGEYDLVFDTAAGTVTQQGETIHAPELRELLTLGDDLHTTLDARARAVAALKRAAAADACEMTVVSLYTGYTADVESMHYPVARPAELADIYAERKHGGLIGAPGSVEVFSMLRLPGEASFAGGVFVVVRTNDDVTWEMLRGKGHVVSRDGRYACLFWPYHAMGIETPLTVRAAVDGAPGRVPRQHTVLAARTTEPMEPGRAFRVEGHHHEIAGVAPVLVAAADAPADLAAYYLLSGAHLVRPVGAGELISLSDLEGVDPAVERAFRTARSAT
jgi:predicted homoserine dehydrogenase-like protein